MIVCGWLAFWLVVVSFVFLGAKNPVGWIIGAGACAIWLVITFLNKDWPMFFQQSFLLVYSIINFMKWNK